MRGASARIAVGVRLPYPVRADEAAQRIRERAETRTAALTGLSVPRAEVRVDALSVAAPHRSRRPSPARPATRTAPAHGSERNGVSPRRSWRSWEPWHAGCCWWT
ncbi:hypothetical protein ACN24K_28905 [Streptomyces microflavus]